MEGERVMKAPENGKKKMWLIVTGVVLGALLAAYLGLCAWVGTMDRIFPNTTIAGLDVSGMTVEQARKALDQAMAEHGDEIAGTITYGEWRGTITASQMNYDAGGLYRRQRSLSDPGRAVRRQTFGQTVVGGNQKYGNNRTGAPAGPDGTGSGR